MRKIFASGEGLNLKTNQNKDIELGRVVGTLDLGYNNGDNIFGWSGDKVVVNVNDELYILDFVNKVRFETFDGVLIREIDDLWKPSENDNLYQFPLSYRGVEQPNTY